MCSLSIGYFRCIFDNREIIQRQFNNGPEKTFNTLILSVLIKLIDRWRLCERLASRELPSIPNVNVK